MGTKNLVMLKTHIKLCFPNDFVYENLIWALASAWIFLCNYMVHSMGLILTYIFRYQKKNEQVVPFDLVEQNKRDRFEDYEIDQFTEEVANLIFPSYEDFHIESEEREEETEYSVLVESDCDNQQDDEKGKGEKDCSVFNEDGDNSEEETKGSFFIHSLTHDVKKVDEYETECSVFIKGDSYLDQDGRKCLKTIYEEEELRDSVFIEEEEFEKKDFGDLEEEPMILSFSFLRNDALSSVENIKGSLVDENEAECSVFIKGDSDFHLDGRKSVENIEEEEETKGFNSTTSKCSLVQYKDISVFDEEPMFLSFSFLRNVTYDNELSSIGNIEKKELLEHNLEEFHVFQDDESEFVKENRKLTSNSNDDSLTCKIIGSKNSCEEFECESLEELQDLKETHFSCDREEDSASFVEREYEKEETMYEEELDEMDYEEDEDDEDEFEWENDEVMEQIKLELKNARQGGLATILEEEEEEREYSSKVVEEKIKPLSIEEKMEYKDHIVEIQKVYNCYAQKIKKLDVLNFQAMHAIGLLQLKDPPKLFLMQKSTVQQVKPLVIPQNLWPRKAQKNTIDPMLKLVNELHRDLEIVYVGQICLSWEILCWQHEKIKELKKYDSPRPRRYNLVAGEFQLFQVLMQRFLEDEPFRQDHRVQNYVKNRCVIRNLLQVPIIKDDSTKDKKKIKWGEEDGIASERLEQIIKKSMQVFWKFVRADKDDEKVFHKVFHHHKENEVKDTEISELLRGIQIQLNKKERKLKERLRSGNCIVRKFQKHNEDQIQLDHEQFLAQVGLRLISKVINMKKLTKDHLIWCNEKLNQINFVDKKIQVEYSFLLFPC